MYYNGLFKQSEMLFAYGSKFYLSNDKAYVTFSLRKSENFTSQYANELELDFFNLFDFKERTVTDGFVFTVQEALERVIEDKQDLFVYLICKTMFMKKICPDIENLRALNLKVVRYQKKKFMKLLCGFRVDFVNRFQSAIYSAIVDSMDKVLDVETNDDRYHRYAYKTMLVGKEYLDDLEAFLKQERNVGYPRASKAKLKERPFENAIKLAMQVKNK